MTAAVAAAAVGAMDANEKSAYGDASWMQQTLIPEDVFEPQRQIKLQYSTSSCSWCVQAKTTPGAARVYAVEPRLLSFCRDDATSRCTASGDPSC